MTSSRRRMSSVHLPRLNSTRGRSGMEVDRETFEKTQIASIQKAINIQEAALKEKHARIIIIGTHQEKGASLFWGYVRRQSPVQDNPVVAWKFCHVLHKVLRDGHHQVVSDSYKNSRFITDLGRLWGHLKDGYGQIITNYCKLLNQKIAFHRKNSSIPGNLMLSEDQLEKICNNDINTYFELSVDMLDYMEDVLLLQQSVFSSVEMLHFNSMTSGGQCRLAPLTLCVQDSCQLYDFLVRILFRLHASISPDSLSGHRERFYKQYKLLTQFYNSVRKLQYFKNLITVPVLPDSPPNFLQASELHSHVRPVVVIPDPEPEPPEDSHSGSDHMDTAIDLLVDTTSMEEAAVAAQNHSSSSCVDHERQISQLMWEVSQLKAELVRIRGEDLMVIESLHNRIKDLELEVNELKQISESTTQENEVLKNVLKDSEKNAVAASHLENIEKISKGHEEKYKKMKDIYSNLREEHVKLLKNSAECTKQLNSEKKLREEFELKHKAVSEAVNEIQREKAKIEESLLQKSSDTAAVEAITSERDKWMEENKKLEEHLKSVEETKTATAIELAKQKAELDQLKDQLKTADEGRSTAEQQMQQLTNEKLALAASLEQQESAVKKLRDDLNAASSSGESSAQQLALRSEELNKLQQQLLNMQQEKLSLEQQFESKKLENENALKDISALNSSKEALTAESKKLSDELEQLKSNLQQLSTNHSLAEQQLGQKQQLLDGLHQQMQQLAAEKETNEQKLNREANESRLRLIECTVGECELIIKEALAQADNPQYSTTTCTAEYLLTRTQPALDSLTSLKQSYTSFQNNPASIGDLVVSLMEFGHCMSNVIVCGIATSHSAQIEPGEEMVTKCKKCGDQSLNLLPIFKSKEHLCIQSAGARFPRLLNSNETSVVNGSSSVDAAIREVITLAEELLPKVEDIDSDAVGDLVDEELRQTTKAIEEAEAKIAAMLASSRMTDSGIKLEVNENILDSCNALMLTIKVLIEKSKVLQREIVAQGRGTTSLKEFYKKHHRWSEGLISAAKAVGWSANVLVDSADKSVKGNGRWEELVVCSQEIAASTAQLVVASKVKAERGSENLQQLSEASKGVTQATGRVVASAKSAAQRTEDIDTLDFSRLTLHQAKKQEMESQIHVLELQKELDKEHKRLSELRKTHYKLAGESEGWDQETLDNMELEDDESKELAQRAQRLLWEQQEEDCTDGSWF